jgi:hypothetical protein
MTKNEVRDRDRAWRRLMTPLGKRWSRKFDRIAKSEGWAMFDADGLWQIQAIDEPEGDNPLLSGGDAEAYDLVARKAAAGSRMHILALFLEGRRESEIWVPKFLLGMVPVL